jgi:hypothetical protein
MIQESVAPHLVDGSAELHAMLRVSHPETKIQPTDWNAAEKALGMPLPSDYKSFIDSFGSGTLGDITIVAPHGPPGFDLFALQEKKREDAVLLRPAPHEGHQGRRQRGRGLGDGLQAPRVRPGTLAGRERTPLRRSRPCRSPLRTRPPRRKPQSPRSLNNLTSSVDLGNYSAVI